MKTYKGMQHPEVFYRELKDKIGYARLKDFEGAALFEYENTEDIEEGLKRSYQYIKERVEHE